MDEEQLEIAARKYCEWRGVNPDTSVDVDDEWTRPYWMEVAKEIKDLYLKQEAIKFALNNNHVE